MESSGKSSDRFDPQNFEGVRWKDFMRDLGLAKYGEIIPERSAKYFFRLSFINVWNSY